MKVHGHERGDLEGNFCNGIALTAGRYSGLNECICGNFWCCWAWCCCGGASLSVFVDVPEASVSSTSWEVSDPWLLDEGKLMGCCWGSCVPSGAHKCQAWTMEEKHHLRLPTHPVKHHMSHLWQNLQVSRRLYQTVEVILDPDRPPKEQQTGMLLLFMLVSWHMVSGLSMLEMPKLLLLNFDKIPKGQWECCTCSREASRATLGCFLCPHILVTLAGLKWIGPLWD